MHHPLEFHLPMRVVAKHDGGGYKRDAKRHAIMVKNAQDIRDKSRQYAPKEPWTCAVRVDTWFVLKMNKMMFRQKVLEHYGDWLPCEKTPDADNLRKQVLDALQLNKRIPREMQKPFFDDDKRVGAGVSLKTWGEQDGVYVRIAEIDVVETKKFWKMTKPKWTAG